MFIRASILLTLMLSCIGCGKTETPPGEDAASYPVRSDWLVVNVPTGVQPSKWYEPGYPPLASLNRPHETLAGDDALLLSQAQKRVILNTKKVEPDLRDEFDKVLTELYGTPREPKVPSGPMLVESTKLGDKLNTLRDNFSAKLAEVQTLKDAAKTPDDQQLVGIIGAQANTMAADILALEDRINQLQTFDSELKLDSDTLKQGGVLYRNYCQQCHGLTGDGAGPGGKYLVPLPRDYRQGLFKFITTDPGVGGKRKPSRGDLHRTITKGMDGSPMPQFGALSDKDVQAIISYVIHLSMRGETEYEVMKKAADPGADEMDRGDVRKGLLNQASITIPLWVQSGRTPIVPDANPYPPEKWAEAAANGHKLFNDAKVGCTTCHTGYGKAAPYQFDSWGSIVRPRNLTVPTLRGGRKPEEIYARIYGGILGSNMPAHTHLRPTEDEKLARTNKVWDLVHFVLYAAESDKRQELKDKFQVEIDP